MTSSKTSGCGCSSITQPPAPLILDEKDPISPFHIHRKIQSLTTTNLISDSNNAPLFPIISNLFVAAPSTAENTQENALYVTLDQKTLQNIVETRPETFALTLPDQRIASLLKVRNIANGFYIESSTEGKVDPATCDIGVHYRGSLNDSEVSTVALSFYGHNEVLGSIYANATQYILAPSETSSSSSPQHIYVQDSQQQNFGACHTPHDLIPSASITELSTPNSITLEAAVGKCVREYIVVRNEIFVRQGGRQSVINYVTALMNQSYALCANDGISVKTQAIYIYETPDPFTGTTTGALLSSFQSNITNWPGDLAQLLGLQGNGGVAAGFQGLCNSDRRNSMCYSGVSLRFNNIPTYSWDVYLCSHERNHLLCSPHTHFCGWNGNNTAIDGCAGYTEGGNCPLPGLPTGGGYVMSYCHLLSQIGVNFNLGLGSQGRNLILNRIAASPCLQNCDDVKPLPVLAVSPLTLNFQASSGGSNPVNQSLSITNAGGSTLTWIAAENVAWLGLSATSGTAPSSIVVSVNVAGMNAGSYSGVINLTSPSGGSKAVTVTLTVTSTNPSPCQGGTVVNGTLDYKGDRVYLSIYQTTTVAAQQISLNSSVLGSDFELGLLQYTASTQKWAQVASSTGPTSTESITYTGPAGYYAPYVESYTGNGPFTACVKVPAGTTTTDVQIPKGLPVGLLMTQELPVETKEEETESSGMNLEASFLQLERDLRDPSQDKERLLARIECLKVATALRLLSSVARK